MIVDGKRQLAWGGWVPENTTIAWGARAIYHLEPIEVTRGKDGKRLKRPRAETRATIDLLWDRQCLYIKLGADEGLARLLQAWLNETALPELKKRCEKEYLAGDSEDTIEIDEHGSPWKLVASPNGSCGYLYITAWSKMYIKPTTREACRACQDPTVIGHTHREG